MTRVALYARYSSDNQRDASIEDQLRICREKAEREKWTVVSAYKDAGISGASMILRPGIQTLLQDAQRQQFDVVLAEALDRISRDQADVATLFKHLRFAGVPIITLAEGEISELHVGLKGTMNALFLKDLAAKTHRGLRGRVEDGKSGGGLCYGYRVVKKLDERGELIRGDREIDEVQAIVARRIFKEFASGISPRTIARTLNAEGVAGPDGSLWNDSTIRGHVKRGTGIINIAANAPRQNFSSIGQPASTFMAAGSGRTAPGDGNRHKGLVLSFQALKNRPGSQVLRLKKYNSFSCLRVLSGSSFASGRITGPMSAMTWPTPWLTAGVRELARSTGGLSTGAERQGLRL